VFLIGEGVGAVEQCTAGSAGEYGRHFILDVFLWLVLYWSLLVSCPSLVLVVDERTKSRGDTRSYLCFGYRLRGHFRCCDGTMELKSVGGDWLMEDCD
jgi:hypothetical protein